MATVTGEAIWLDGQFVAWDAARVHVLTHTLHYGLGVFEGIRCYQTADGRSAVFRLGDHLRRLYDSAHINLMKVPFERAQLEQACLETLRRNHLPAGYLRPLVFIGDGEMGLNPGGNAIRVAIIAWAWGKYLGEEGVERGIRAKISTLQPPLREREDDQGQDLRRLRELDPRQARGAARRLRRGDPARLPRGSCPRRRARTSSSCATA